MNRRSRIAALGEIDREAGEFWVENPFMMLSQGQNLSAFERNCVFLNLAGREFLDVSFASQADIDADSRSVIAADFDGDGSSDLLVGSAGGGPLRLFANRLGQQAARVRIRLTGTASNRAAIGSRVVIETGNRRIVRDLFPANGFMGQAPASLLVGLGDARRIERLVVRWPNGETQHFEDLDVNTQITITEGSGDVTVTPVVRQ